MIEKLNTLSTLTQKMSWQTARGERLNQNLANVETPGFKHTDIEPFKPHAPSTQATHYRTVEDSQELSREHDMLTLIENATDYQSNLQLFRKYMNFMKIVMSVNK